MKISLYAEHEEFHIPIPMEYATLLETQLERLSEPRERRAFVEGMLKQYARLLSKFLDPDLSPPTEKQVAFAHRLGRKHGVEVPRDALIYKDAMHDFLDKYAKKEVND